MKRERFFFKYLISLVNRVRTLSLDFSRRMSTDIEYFELKNNPEQNVKAVFLSFPFLFLIPIVFIRVWLPRVVEVASSLIL